MKILVNKSINFFNFKEGQNKLDFIRHEFPRAVPGGGPSGVVRRSADVSADKTVEVADQTEAKYTRNITIWNLKCFLYNLSKKKRVHE